MDRSESKRDVLFQAAALAAASSSGGTGLDLRGSRIEGEVDTVNCGGARK